MWIVVWIVMWHSHSHFCIVRIFEIFEIDYSYNNDRVRRK